MDTPIGLLTQDSAPVPLLGVSVRGEILGRGAKVRLSQRYRNQERKPIEAVYKFPLPEGAAICGFFARIDGRSIQGVVEEREEAFRRYDKALQQGHGAQLLDEERPNLFTLSVGNLKPNSEAVIEIEYVTLLEVQDGKTRFHLPTTISPRYVPDGMPEQDGIPEGDKIHPVYADQVPYGLSLLLKIHGGNRIELFESPSHPIRVEVGDPALVSLSSESTRMDRDFLLYWKQKDPSASSAYRSRKGEEVYLQLDLATEPPHAQDPDREILFVLDCSGSMAGDSITEAKKALEVSLKGLREGSSFNLLRFGSEYRSLFPHAEPYSEKTLTQALEYLKRVDADLGGTEIMGVLRHIYSDPPSRKREILLLTDGEVGNEQEVISLVRAHREQTRFFPLGIGAGPNEFFIQGVARAGRGVSEFIYPGERIEPKVLQVFRKVWEESLEELSISWGDGTWEKAPGSPSIFLGGMATIFAKGQADRPSLLVQGKIQGEEKRWEVKIIDQPEGSLPLSTLWARERIRDLEEGGEEAGSRQIERKTQKIQEAIIGLSKQYGLLSTLTSFVAIEEREEKDKATGEIVLRKVPALVTVGWHGRGGLLPPQAGVQFCLDATIARPAAKLRSQRTFFAESARITTATRKPDQTDFLMEILSLQRGEGGFDISEQVLEALGLELKEIKKLASALGLQTPGDKLPILFTAILLEVLGIHFQAEKATWEGVIEKSRTWLDRIIEEGRPKIDGKDLPSWAKEFVEHRVKIEL